MNITSHSRNCLAIVAASLGIVAGTPADGQPTPPLVLTVQTDQPGAKINPAMWGIFFEDINFGADGGLYAELVKNRSFEFPDAMMGWRSAATAAVAGRLSIQTNSPCFNANPKYLRIEADVAGGFGVANEGFRGIGVKAGELYDFSAHVRVLSGTPTLTVELVSTNGEVLAQKHIINPPRAWDRVETVLRPKATVAKAHLRVLLDGAGKADLDFISLFPRNTWKQRPGGLRADMVQALADLKPGFMRFPGGCIVEGFNLGNRYQWKKTIGPVEERQTMVNRWNMEFKHRPAPDYFQSFGLGFFEYFQLCEDIGAEPLPILGCGLACQFNSGEACPLDQLEPYIQDALDLIEFANGPVTSRWGAQRAAMGHPRPFNLKMIGIGNENWMEPYLERYAKFHTVLKAKHPEIQLVSSAGPSPADERFEFAWPKLRELKADIVDEHCYANPVWFLSQVDRFDRYDRRGPKVFFGEYAAQSDKIVSVENKNDWECALAEAAFMTGMERNADVVRMASYAPLFAHVDAWQWKPDLIWVDNQRVSLTPNYYVQQLFMHHRGDAVLPVQLTGAATPTAASGGVELSTFKGSAEFKDISVTTAGQTLFTRATATNNLRFGDSQWRDYTLSLKARKTGGQEGFLVRVRSEKSNTYVQWNLGGWGNTRHGLQSELGVQGNIVAQVPGHIEANRWYDVRIELVGPQVRCFLDGQLVQSAEIALPRREGVFASATRDEQSGEIILKVANVGPASRNADIALAGVKRVTKAKAIELRGIPSDENALNGPEKITPHSRTLAIRNSHFRQEFAPNSFTVLRLKTK